MRGTLDREARDRYDLTVLASDNGTPSATATARVIINVMDSNDNDPKFLRASYEFSVEENMRRGAVVGVIQAKDADLDINAAIRYSLIPSNTSFQINSISGEYLSRASFVLFSFRGHFYPTAMDIWNRLFRFGRRLTWKF